MAFCRPGRIENHKRQFFHPLPISGEFQLIYILFCGDIGELTGFSLPLSIGRKSFAVVVFKATRTFRNEVVIYLGLYAKVFQRSKRRTALKATAFSVGWLVDFLKKILRTSEFSTALLSTSLRFVKDTLCGSRLFDRDWLKEIRKNLE